MTIFVDPPQKKYKCGIVMPISDTGSYTEAHWADVLNIFKEAFKETEFQVELVSDANDVGVIQKRIVQNLYSCELVVCDVSAKNANVMFELGMRLAFDKPTIIVKDEETSYSFDTSPIEHLSYPRSLHYQSIQEFKAKLRDKSLATFQNSQDAGYTTFLKHFGEFVVAKIEAKPVSKEDYILRELGDLRTAITELLGRSAKRAELVEAPEIARFVSGSSHRPSLVEMKFVSDYLARKDWHPDDIPSEAFNELLIDYVKLFGGRLPVPGSSAKLNEAELRLSAVLKSLTPTG